MRTKADRTVKFRRPRITDYDGGPTYSHDEWITGAFHDEDDDNNTGLCVSGVSEAMNIPDNTKTMWVTLSAKKPRHADAVKIVMSVSTYPDIDEVDVIADGTRKCIYGRPARILRRFIPHEGDTAWATFYHDGSPDKKRRTR